MIEYKRANLLDKYFAIEILDCHIDVVIFAASLGSNNVTIENYRHNINPTALSILITDNNSTIKPKLKQFLADFQISKTDFISLKRIWNSQGCYAVFHESDEIKFKMTDLDGLSRYKALDNFKWVLEMAIPDGSSDGWGQIVSPNQDIIDKIEHYIMTLVDH